MEGIEILATKTVQIPLIVPILITALAVLWAAFVVMFAINTFKETDGYVKNRMKAIFVLQCVLAVILSLAAVSFWCDRTSGTYKEYTVLIEDEVSFNAFNDMYEMVSHDGSGLYVVRDLKDGA